MLTTMESDQEDMINEEGIQTLRSIQKPLATHPQPETEEENSNDEGSLTESDELSMIGEDLVNRSLAEVTSLLDQQIDLNHGGTSGTGLTSGGNGNNETTRKTTKRISFLVPTSVCPQISISSAGSVASVVDDDDVVQEKQIEIPVIFVIHLGLTKDLEKRLRQVLKKPERQVPHFVVQVL